MAKRSNSLIPAKGQTPIEIIDSASEEISVTSETYDQIQRFMGGVVAFFATAAQLESRAQATLMAARTLTAPYDAGSDAVVQTIIRRATAEKKVIEEHWHPITSTVNNFHRWLTSARRRGTDPLEEAGRIAQPLHNSYVQQEQRRVAAENERLRQEQERLAWEQRQRDLAAIEAQATEREEAAAELSARVTVFVAAIVAGVTPYEAAKRAGYKTPADSAARLTAMHKISDAIKAQVEAAALRRQALATAQQPLQVAEVAEVRPNLAKSVGGFDRTTYSADVFDEAAFVAAVFDGTIPRDVLVVDQKKVNDYARSLRENLSRWPGVRIVKTTRTQ